MKRIALALFVLLFAACDNAISLSSVDAGSDASSGVASVGDATLLACPFNPCQNGGVCSAVEDGYKCTCLPGYTGVNCETLNININVNVNGNVIVHVCPSDSDDPLCQMNECALIGVCGHGTCDGAGGCTCNTGWQGETCSENIDECASRAPCLHGGDCTDSAGSFSCDCTTGYTGMTCADCANGYQDDDENGSCELIDECALAVANGMTPCLNGGTCIDGIGSYTCQCSAGYLGADCGESDDCAGDPCNGHGTCSDGDDDFSCTCNAGWLGDTCDAQDFCVGHQCQHSGVCVNSETDYNCDCTGTGYDGNRCQSKIDFCANTPCQHGGVCSDIGTNYACDCAKTGFTGASCETDVDECADVQADVCGAGTCVNAANGAGFTCQCPDGTLDLDSDGKNCSPVASLAAGGVNTCAISTAGSLHCWGDNTHAQLGIDTSGNPAGSVIRVPARVGTGTGWTKVSVGNGHACGLRSGHLYCWGNNTSRQVGFSTSSAQRVPAEPRTDLTWSDVTTGDAHSCGLAGTSLYCWGNTADGQAGTAAVGTTVDAPKQITGSWTAVSAGGNHTCAISATNELRCWGNNTNGQLGSAQPVALPGGADGPWSAVTAGRTHTCAVAGTRTYCWGAGIEGALGNGAFSSSTTPVQVSTSAQLSAHELGQDFSCGRVNDADGGSAFQIYCWGTNLDSLLLTADTKVNVPQVVTTAGSPAWTAYAVGTHHMCAVAAGLVYCWGSNVDGAVGNAVPGSSPVTIPALVKAGVTSHSAANCWPNPCRNGGECTELANGYTCDCAGTGFGGTNCTTETDECATAGICGQGTCRDLLDNDGYTCTCPDGLIDVNQTGTTCAAVQQISAGSNHTCVLTAAQTLHCWGSNFYGQFGLGTVGTSDYYPYENTQTYRTPLRVKTVTGVTGDASGWTKLAVGEKHTCATLPIAGGSAEALYCWGDNAFGQVGIPVVAPQYAAAPVLLDNTQTWTALAAGYGHTCGINASGALYCWGLNTSGQIGNNSTTSPVAFSLTAVPLPVGQTSWIAVAGGNGHTCAITNTNTTYCWGVRTAGQVGIGATGAPVLVPTKVNRADPQGFTAVQADFSTSCALVGTAAYCWGQGNSGAIGNGANTTANPSPVAVSGGLSFSSLALGSNFGCGLVAVPSTTPQAYRAHCWGSNAKDLHLTGVTTAAGNINVPTALTTRQWRVFDVGPTHICGVDNADGLLYCWGDNGLEGGLGKGKLGSIPFSMLGNFGIGVVKAAPAPHAAP